ncbi:MAG: hypothetical protein PVH30_13700 [Desulfobacterales bacterium]
MGIQHDIAFPGLPENVVQFDRRHRAGTDDIPQQVSGTHRWELVSIPHQEQNVPDGTALSRKAAITVSIMDTSSTIKTPPSMGRDSFR